MLIAHNWKNCVPKNIRSVFENASLHSIAAAERAVLMKLRTMTDTEFEALPYGSEGLWRKLMHASRQESTLEDIITATKSKRYTRSRINRMVMCAFLGISQEMLETEAPYIRTLAFNEKGRDILRSIKKKLPLLNAGEASPHSYWELEKRCGDLYGLFCVDGIEGPGREEDRRIYYQI